MKKHFVTFFSPGSFFSEMNIEPIDSWDINEAQEMARSIKQRYDAIPYGFQFSTKERGDNELDSKVVETSNMYYLGGRVETYEMVLMRDDPTERILRSNMRNNGYDRILVNTNSWKSTHPLEENDVVLDWNP